MRCKQTSRGDLMFSYKIFRQNDDILLAISDSDIIGKTFKEDEVEIKVTEDFYSDKLCNDTEAKDLIKNSTIINAIGENIINLLLKENMIDEEKILRISGVPHAQIIAIK